MLGIMEEHTERVMAAYPEGSFARLFWEEQLKASSVADKRQVRWHPIMVKWCLNLKLLSSSAYHAMRSSGFLKLPSERTLRDYTNYFSNNPGFMDEVDDQLTNKISLSLPSSRQCVALLLDEMKVKEGLVYHKYSGKIIGFTSLGDVNDELVKMEKDGELQLAKHVLVRRILFKLEFPYAHFGTQNITGDLLLWESIRRFEAREIKVLCVTADGASPNRKFLGCIIRKSIHIPHTIHAICTLPIVVGSISFQTHLIFSKPFETVGHIPGMLVLGT